MRFWAFLNYLCVFVSIIGAHVWPEDSDVYLALALMNFTVGCACQVVAEFTDEP